jgi:hypothetical protein
MPRDQTTGLQTLGRFGQIMTEAMLPELGRRIADVIDRSSLYRTCGAVLECLLKLHLRVLG